MHRYDPGRQRLALGLAGLAGLVDATGFVVAGGYFTSFMSGNTTRMGVELVHSPALALAPLGLIGAFLAGVTGGALVRLGQGIAARLAGEPLASTRGHGLLWSALALGVAVGGALCLVAPLWAAALAAIAAVALWGFAFAVER